MKEPDLYDLCKASQDGRLKKAIKEVKMNRNNKDLIKQLTDFKACEDAIKWVKNNKYSLKTAWKKCKRADWLLWYMCRTEMATQKERIHIICDCAETALKYVPKGEDRPRLAIEAARKYADNPTEKNLAKLNKARAATWAAGNAARAAGDAARAAGDAAGNAAWDATWAAGNATHKKMCRMIRRKIKI
jgi:hypothetical protein